MSRTHIPKNTRDRRNPRVASPEAEQAKSAAEREARKREQEDRAAEARKQKEVKP